MAAAEVHVGRLDVGADQVERLMALLDPAERDRAERFRFARDRRRFIVRRANLRQVLAAATGDAPERIEYTENAYGKPALASGDLCFSTSHSHERWAVALSDRPLGIDIEYRDASVDWRNLAAELFGPGENTALAALAPEDALRGFYDCWARKEAFVKAIGMGLSYPLDAFEVSVEKEARLLNGAGGCTIRTVSLDTDYAAALVVADDHAPVAVTVRQERARALLPILPALCPYTGRLRGL